MSLLEIHIQKHFASNGASPGFELDLSLDCEAGVTVLFGASGSGKTLTLDAIAGFLRPDHGRILLNNEILFDAQSGVFLPPRRRGIGYVFQNYALFPHMTVEQNLAFGISRLPGLERHRRVREMLEVFGLAARAARRPHELSGGEQQRASIARALIPRPRLLLFDEPARGLDYPLRMDFYAVVRRIRDDYRIPILLVTHDVTESFLLGGVMAVCRAGRIIQTGKPGEIFARPRNPAVARLLGNSNVYRGTVEALDPMAGSSLIRAAGFAVTAPYLPGKLRGDAVTFCISSEQVTLVSRAETAASPNRVPVRITSELSTPFATRLLMNVEETAAEGGRQPPQIETEVSLAEYARLGIGSQKEWWATLPAGAIHVFADDGE